MMDFFLAYLAALLVPGALLSALLGVRENRFASAVALSLGFLVPLLVLCGVLGGGPAEFAWGAAVGCLVMGGLVLWKRGARLWPGPGVTGSGGVAAIPVLTFALIVLYCAWAGPYTEIPADAWWHIGQIQDRFDSASAGNIGPAGNLDFLFNKFARYWYTIIGVFLALTESEPESALSSLALANTLLFCGGVYSFALYLFSGMVEGRAVRHCIAAASVFFFFTHFGISVFSYPRYYVYAPTLLNYVVYFSAMYFFLKFLERESGGYHFAIASAYLGVTAAMLHLQEAIFIGAMAGIILLVLQVQQAAKRPAPDGAQQTVSFNRTRVILLLAGFAAAYLLAHGWAYLYQTRHNPLAHGLMADVRNYLPFIQNLYILKPTHQFYQVLTVWGVLVYLLFAFQFRRFLVSPYLVAGMLVPFLTVFNPVFTDFFLRFSWPEVLWRMCYLIPLPFLGAYFLVRGVQAALRGPGTVGRISGAGISVLLLVLLLPVHTTYFASPYSKIYTLTPVDEENSHKAWGDVFEFLATLDAARIITDPVTGYVINGLTDHKYPGYKFYEPASYITKVDEDSYEWNEFHRNRNWLVVINTRDGGDSAVGRHGGHWPEDVMKVSARYSAAFIAYVEGHPDVFRKIWDQRGIAVYRVGPEA